MMGIDVDRTIAFTFALGGALAGAAGTLFVMFQTSTRFDLGFQLGLFAFTAAVLGGIGNLTGAALGALLIGLIQAFNEGLSWHTPGSDWTESITFAILILVLVFRPAGPAGRGRWRTGHDGPHRPGATRGPGSRGGSDARALPALVLVLLIFYPSYYSDITSAIGHDQRRGAAHARPCRRW